ncbi:hypothetical protein [Pseudonocardia sp. GCM10023141]
MLASYSLTPCPETHQIRKEVDTAAGAIRVFLHVKGLIIDLEPGS